jgi:hypothetical protein
VTNTLAYSAETPKTAKESFITPKTPVEESRFGRCFIRRR